MSPVPATDEHDRMMPGPLHMHEAHDGHKSAHMKACRRGIEADIRCYRTLGESSLRSFGGVL